MASAASVTNTDEKGPPSIDGDTESNTRSNLLNILASLGAPRKHPLNHASGATKLLQQQKLDFVFVKLREHKNIIADLEDELKGLLGAQTTSLQKTFESLAKWITDVEHETTKQQELNAHIVGGHIELMDRVEMLEKRMDFLNRAPIASTTATASTATITTTTATATNPATVFCDHF